MSLKTFEVPWLDGRVRFTTQASSFARVTVECFYRKLAFCFDHRDPVALAPGRWIRFRGVVRFDPSVRKDGSMADDNLGYMHDPNDMSPRHEWMFFNLLKQDVKVLAPKEAIDSMRETVILMRRHLDSWIHNCRVEVLDQTIESMESSLRALRVVRDDAAVASREPTITVRDLEL